MQVPPKLPLNPFSEEEREMGLSQEIGDADQRQGMGRGRGNITEQGPGEKQEEGE